MKNQNYKNQKGYALVEMLFYIAIFSVLTLAVVNSLITMTKSFKSTAIQADLVQSSGVMERISREIRQADSINSISASDLKINTRDALDNVKTVRFLLSGSDVLFYENDVLTGNLNTTNIDVTTLSFTEITTAQSKAIRILLSAQSVRDGSGRVADFFNTVALRGDYGN
jgi:competence protein ComGC